MLLVEDSEHDAFFLTRQLRTDGLEVASWRVDNRANFEAALAEAQWDIIVSDYVVPGFGGPEALDLAKRHAPGVPFIMVSGARGEEVAVETMRAGATDYLTKANLGRLRPIIERALEEAAERRRSAALELRLRDLENQRERLQAIARMSGGLAHEINNMLQPILGAAEFLIDDLPPGSATHEDATVIRRCARDASAIVQNVLAFARGDQQDLPEIDIRECLLRNEEVLRRSLGGGVQLALSVLPDPCLVRGSEPEFLQILVNLLRNADRAMGGRGVITIGLRCDAGFGEAGGVQIEVTDTGPGICTAEIGRIFEPFFSGSNSQEGSGLGLSVVYGIVKRWGGDILADNLPGSGARFTIRLPRITVGRPEDAHSWETMNGTCAAG
ncbi:sensor histidine kinase [Marinibaculum pumilum]|uniref:histidine kinase n=1 Tax=Marinibaculum pumilum TaxID=1766165 RepID=A0ABV7KTY7_9PROT